MSRRDQLFQAVNSVQGQVYGFIDTHVGNAGPSQSAGQSSTGIGGGGQTYRPNPNLPVYTNTHSSSGPQSLPQALVNAPPGQAQAIADQLPQSKIANGSGREARAAAAALREEQMRSGQLKTKHTFISSGARVILDIHTVPQKALTFMGGTAARGRGAMKGTVTIHAQPNERVTSIRIKIKAVVRVLVPRTGTPQQPFQLERGHPSVDACVEKEDLLLQLESQLYDAKSYSSSDSSDPTLLAVGPHEFPFTIDLPSETSKGVELPPSFVLAPLNKPEQVPKPQPKNRWEVITSSIPAPLASNDWASVKWYVKLTIERPGLLRSNERIFAPFVYLPPPPTINGMSDQLSKRLRLVAECDSLLRQFHAIQGARPIDLQRLTEPLAQWEAIKLPYGQVKKGNSNTQTAKAGNSTKTDAKGSSKAGFLSKMLFGAQVEPEKIVNASKETFTLHLPKKPYIYPLRTGIPYVVSRQVHWTGKGTPSASSLSRIPNLGLFQRANVYARGKTPVAGTTLRFLTTGRHPPDTQPVCVKEERSGAGQSQQTNRRTEFWLGILDLPPGCAPCFETPSLTLEYSLGVRGPTTPEIIHSEPIVLVCPPSKPVRIAVPSQPPSRTGTPSSEAARRRRQGSSDAVASAPAVHNVSGRPSVSKPSAIAASTSTASNATKPVPQARPLPVRPGGQASEAANTATIAAAEKRALQARYDEQARLQAGQNNPQIAGPSTSTRPVQNATALMAAQAPPLQPQAQVQAQAQPTAPLPPPRPQVSVAETQSQMQQLSMQESSVGALTPIVPDDVSANESHNWQFLDDELTDLPPSYFEATGMHDHE